MPFTIRNESKYMENLTVSNNLVVAGPEKQNIRLLVDTATTNGVLHNCLNTESNTFFLIPQLSVGTQIINLPTSLNNFGVNFTFITVPGFGNTISQAVEIKCVGADKLGGELNSDGNGTTTNTTPVSLITLESNEINGNYIKFFCVGSLNSSIQWLMYTYTSSIVDYVWTNTLSVKWTSATQSYKNAPPAGFPLIRPGGGAGASDAWSVSIWYKSTTGTIDPCVIWSSVEEEASIHGLSLIHTMSDDSLFMMIGPLLTGNAIIMRTSAASLVKETWTHLLWTYNGGTTGGAISMGTIITRFKMFVDGVDMTITGTKGGSGWAGAYNPINFGVGLVFAYVSGPMPNTFVDELAVFDYDAQASAALIYNAGDPADLENTVGLTEPVNWWRWTADDTATTVADQIGSYDLAGTDLVTATNIVEDVPPT